MLHACRFCLCQDEACLIPLEDILDFAVGVEDVASLTGIQITEDNIASYFMCLECTHKLKNCINFRKSCLSNDAKFRELCGGINITEDEGFNFDENDLLTAIVEDGGRWPTIKKADDGPVEKIIQISDESSDFDISFLDNILGDSKKEDTGPPKAKSPAIEFVCSSKRKTTHRENPCKCQSCLWMDILMPDRDDNGADVFSYSANYIPPAETVFTEPAVQQTDWQSLNPPAPPPIPYVCRRQRRTLRMCDQCGIWVSHVPSHMRVHLQDYNYNCPHCDMKAKTKTTLTEHIKTVHLKIAGKKCNICGRKFIHRKTYRYHMLSHEGKTFNCPDCSKSFSNAKCFRDHINRLHNAGKQVQKKSAKERTGKKRHRSKSIIEYEEIDSQEGSSAVNGTVEQEEIIVYEEIDSQDDVFLANAIIEHE